MLESVRNLLNGSDLSFFSLFKRDSFFLFLTFMMGIYLLSLAVYERSEGFAPWAGTQWFGTDLSDDYTFSTPGFSAFSDGRWDQRDGVALRSGSRLRDIAVTGGSIECMTHCDSDPQCSVASLDTEGGLCSLFSDSGEPSEVPGAVTMARRDRKHFRELPNARLESSDPIIGSSSSVDAFGCRTRCADTADCVATVWRPSDKGCVLYKTVSGISTPVGTGERSYLKSV